MKIIVHAQDLSGRGDGYYSKPDITSALLPFFVDSSDHVYVDSDASEVMEMNDAEQIFLQEGRIEFYMPEGEKIVMTRDTSESQ